MDLRGIAVTLLFLAIATFRSFFIDVTEYDLSYKIYKKEINFDSNQNINLLYCENEFGRFKIDVSSETYGNFNVNDSIRYDEPFTSFSLYRKAVDEKTKENIANSLNGSERIIIKNLSLQALLIIMSIFCPIFLIIVLAQILNGKY